MEKIEIQYLREEMMMLFDRIKFVLVFWIGSYGGALGYYLKNPDSIPAPYALVGLLIIVYVGSMYILRKQSNIYKIGTFIAIEHEKTNANRWHRANRQFDDYMSKRKVDWKLKVLRLTLSWGSDITFYGLLTFILTFLSTIVVLNNNGTSNPFDVFNGYQLAWCGNFILGLLYFMVILNIASFLIIPKLYKGDLRFYWKKYLEDFSSGVFTDKYS